MKRAKGFPCRWGCGRPTKNISRICDPCWARREHLRTERKRERSEGLSEGRRSALVKARSARRARMAVPSVEIASSERSGGERPSGKGMDGG